METTVRSIAAPVMRAPRRRLSRDRGEKQHHEDGRYQRNCAHDHLLRSEVGWRARPGKPEDQDDAQQPAERDTACQDHHLALNHRSLAKFLLPVLPSRLVRMHTSSLTEEL